MNKMLCVLLSLVVAMQEYLTSFNCYVPHCSSYLDPLCSPSVFYSSGLIEVMVVMMMFMMMMMLMSLDHLS